MKICTKCGVEKDFDLFHKDKTRRDGLRNCCKLCVSAYMAENHVKNKDKIMAKAVAWVAANREKHNAKCARWAKNNPASVNARTARRYAAKTRATPAWLTADDLWLIAEAYDLAKIREKLFGFSWEVDHIVPLRGKCVSGLHVPWNLRVVPCSDNRRKSNKFEVA